MRKTEILQTEKSIALIKQTFANELSKALNLHPISSPMLVNEGTGINDDLNGVEKAVSFPVKFLPTHAVIVHSLAKWKRIRLQELDLPLYEGIITDMRAIRADEEYSPLHSIYVDQWDWELRIDTHNRCLSYLKAAVRNIYKALKETEAIVWQELQIEPILPDALSFIHAEQLLQLYPTLSPKEREQAIVKAHKAVFIIGVGHPLSDGQPHDSRASDYDDWSTTTEEGYKGLNGDLLVWHPILEQAVELSSMGIRVDKTTLLQQLALTQTSSRMNLYYHQLVLQDQVPLSIGGGIGQSRLCMFLLRKRHIGEVQVSLWPTEVRTQAIQQQINLL
ncbi:aspartate--ammonia ligase [Myroides fluvii]|uniref:aspartate--ammonia ligase n=1 Tax=Myroides fluvii TaxID=2572594 RepID=UPI00131AA2F3|nr:aspartate--ammonia ligase [Myroides fluvii]